MEEKHENVSRQVITVSLNQHIFSMFLHCDILGMMENCMNIEKPSPVLQEFITQRKRTKN